MHLSCILIKIIASCLLRVKNIFWVLHFENLRKKLQLCVMTVCLSPNSSCLWSFSFFVYFLLESFYSELNRVDSFSSFFPIQWVWFCLYFQSWGYQIKHIPFSPLLRWVSQFHIQWNCLFAVLFLCYVQ